MRWSLWKKHKRERLLFFKNTVYSNMQRVCCFVLFLTLLGCDAKRHYQYHDPSLKSTEKTYEELTQQKVWDKPVFRPPQAAPARPSFPPGFQKTISLSILDAAPLREVLVLLAEQAGVNLTVAKDVAGSVALTATQNPFGVVLDHLCHSNGLRFHLYGNSVVVEVDRPFIKNYPLPFLTGSRETQTQVSLATDLSAMNASTAEGGKFAQTSSNSTLKYSTATNFWKDIQQNVHMILSNHGMTGEHMVSLNETAAIITIQASEKAHKAIDSYFRLLSQSMNAQVLIEAKILEVELTDNFRSGIHWHVMGSFLKTRTEVEVPAASKPGFLHFFLKDQNFETFLSFLKKFGTVRALSSPRLTVMNNQSAMMKVATNKVFFRIEYIRTENSPTQSPSERAYSQVQTVPVGFIMTVHAAVDTQTGRIVLHLRPTISKILSERNDPAVNILQGKNQGIQQQSSIPEIQTKEMDTVLSVISGETIVMGGLMEDTAFNDREGLPGLHALGPLFTRKNDKRTVSELVLFLRASVINCGAETIAPADTQLYQTFCQDPRAVIT